ncbi:alpha/beta fold hydrolase [Photobacterium rosenbergii]|uniref:alpha/beta fold hydrolase n=1 Tax=Photobacterium rosenbergii TaxID=294936 RepID=UPI001C9928B3|nr:alpha/beta hydrolase [Photobacterium rosenbergii]MBY5945446.1 alpha/beta hydrolase [Photobacterium rosenbergii]
MNQSLPLLWLPGLLCDQQLFEPVNALLPDQVVPECASLDVADSMQALASKVLEEAPESFILGGLSMGGILAFEVYRQAPERVKGLVLIDTNAADEMPAVTEKRDALVDRAIAGEFSAITREVLLPVLIHPSRMADVTLTDSICGMAENIGIEAFIAHAKALATRPDARPMLADIWVPSLVICGRDDALCPVSNHLKMAEHIPQVSLHILNDCGHLATMERPHDVAQHISHWIEANWQRGGETA